MAAEAVSIEDSFRTISDRLHKSMEEGGGLTTEGVTEAVALELGVPLEDVLKAVFEESKIGMLFMALAGPRRSLCTTMTLAFLAGVAWEQGRRG